MQSHKQKMMSDIPVGHRWLVERMKKMGYLSETTTGVCFGITNMAMQAIFCDEFEKFTERLIKIVSIDLAEFDKNTFDKKLQTLIGLLKDQQDKTEENKKDIKEQIAVIVDLKAFFDGVELYQDPKNHLELFSHGNEPNYQNTLLSSPLVLSSKLEQETGFVEIDKFSGVYTESDLIKYFELLSTHLKQEIYADSGADINKPITFQVGDATHAILISFGKFDNHFGWMVLDINKANEIFFQENEYEKIAKKITSAFFDKKNSDFIIVSTDVHVKKNDVSLFNNILTNIKNSKEWNDIHEITDYKNKLSDNNGYTLINIAAEMGDLNTIKKLIESGSDIDMDHLTGRKLSSLMIAASRGYTSMVKLLLEYGQEIDQASNASSETPLYLAAEHGYVEIVKILLDAGADVNKENYERITPLFIAVQNNHVDVVNQLLEHGADINIKDNDGSSLLFWAAECGSVDVLKLLVSKGLDVNQANDKEVTPLFAAARNGQIVTVDYLINEMKINPNQAVGQGATLIYIAAKKGHIETVKFLLKNGVGIEQACHDHGDMLLNLAIQNDDDLFLKQVLSYGMTIDKTEEFFDAALNGRFKIISDLIENFSDVNQSRNDGATSLMLAATEGHTNIVDLLLNNKADVNKKCGPDEKSPLLMASQNCHINVVKLLLKNGANVNDSSRDQVTPLFMAAQKGNDVIVETLLNYHANPNITNDTGVTPLYIASDQGHFNSVKIMLKNGAHPNHKNGNGVTPVKAADDNKHHDVFELLVMAIRVNHGKSADMVDGQFEAMSHAYQLVLNTKNKEDALAILVGFNALEDTLNDSLEEHAESNTQIRELVSSIYKEYMNNPVEYTVDHLINKFHDSIDKIEQHNEYNNSKSLSSTQSIYGLFVKDNHTTIQKLQENLKGNNEISQEIPAVKEVENKSGSALGPNTQTDPEKETKNERSPRSSF